VSLEKNKTNESDIFFCRRSVDINIERSKQTRRSISLGHELDDYGAFIEDEEEDK
jgi:hypothetical protein